MGLGRKMDGCGHCMKISMFVVNLLIFFGSALIVALAIWTIVDKSFANTLLGTNLYSGVVYVLLATGIIVSFISCFGCYGSIKEVRCMLVSYFLAIFLIFITMLVGGILGYVFREKVDTTLHNYMIGSIRSYGQNKAITEAWDETQTRLNCCGVTNYADWNGNLPDSCCDQPYPAKRQTCSPTSPVLHKIGCLNVTTKYVKDHAAIIGGAGIAVASLMLLGMIFSCSLYQSIDRM